MMNDPAAYTSALDKIRAEEGDTEGMPQDDEVPF
jgi:hypothetical protein